MFVKIAFEIENLRHKSTVFVFSVVGGNIIQLLTTVSVDAVCAVALGPREGHPNDPFRFEKLSLLLPF